MPNRRLRTEIVEMARGLHELGALDEKTIDEFRKRYGRVVQAPEPISASSVPPPNRVTSVTLWPEEDVVWIWTSTADGGSYVSGYRIVKRRHPRGRTPMSAYSKRERKKP